MEPNAKTIIERHGFKDPDRKNLNHDEIQIWVYKNFSRVTSTLNPRKSLKYMSSKIEPGQNYLLDGKTIVKVLKPINRSLTVFNIEVSDRGVESVEVSRLQPLGEDSLIKK